MYLPIVQGPAVLHVLDEGARKGGVRLVPLPAAAPVPAPAPRQTAAAEPARVRGRPQGLLGLALGRQGLGDGLLRCTLEAGDREGRGVPTGPQPVGLVQLERCLVEGRLHLEGHQLGQRRGRPDPPQQPPGAHRVEAF